MSCFGDINVSQGSVATYARYGWIFNTSLTTNLKFVVKLVLKIYQGIFQ